MSKHKVLVDLRVAFDKGYCGIGQDSCLTFRSLMNNPDVKVDGLLYATHAVGKAQNYQHSLDRERSIAQGEQFFDNAFNNPNTPPMHAFWQFKWKSLLPLLRKDFGLYPLNSYHYETVWEKIFGKYIETKFKKAVMACDFHISELTEQHLSHGAKLGRTITLDTKQHDFAIFPSLNVATVSPNTYKLVRYHDAIPLTHPDFSPTASSVVHARLLNHCKEDSYFICNSEYTLNTLIDLCPELQDKSYVIPSSTSYPYKKVDNRAVVNQIIASRLSEHILPKGKIPTPPENFDYILHVATLDPKKNVKTLVRAWEKLITTHDKQLKLVILANPGWLSAEIEDSMRPHIASGGIIHLRGAASPELETLYSHAQAFVFPSYTEGFGSPPLEALQCECPTIASDIPAHRWVLGNAVLFCNPYSADSLHQTLVQLLYSTESAQLRAALIAKGLERIQLYSHHALSQHWQKMLDTIKTQHKPRIKP